MGWTTFCHFFIQFTMKKINGCSKKVLLLSMWVARDPRGFFLKSQ